MNGYDSQGILLGEVGLNPDLTESKRYRLVGDLTERGQVAEERLGNCVRETGVYDGSTGLAMSLLATRPSPTPSTLPTLDLTTCPATAGTTLVRQDDYAYDTFLNLSRQTKNVTGVQREERFAYDELQRLLSSARCTGAGCVPAAGETDTYGYDDLGNLTSKSDYATSYLYGSSGRTVGRAGPHAVVQLAKKDGASPGFTYDLNGNMLTGDGRAVDFNPLDRPVHVVTGVTATDFDYAPGGGRYREKVATTQTAFGPKTVYSIDKDFELTVWGLGTNTPKQVEERSFIGGSVVVVTTQPDQGVKTREVRYQHVDRLGSMEAVTREDPAASEYTADAHGFDPWGKPRSGTWTPNGDQLHPAGEPGVTSTRGFTGHEHLDPHYLIHMNGRVYDYRLGRFLSVDPIISNPASTQSINPYSYIGNNPLSGTDPTGYCTEGVQKSGTMCKQPWADGSQQQYVLTEGGKTVASGTLSQVMGRLESWFSGAVNAGPAQHGSDPVNEGGTTSVNRQQTAGRDAGGQEGRALQLDRDFRYIPAPEGSGFTWEPVLKNPVAPREGPGPAWYPGANMRNGGLGVLAGIGEGMAGRLTLGSNWKTYASGWRGNQYVSTLKLSTAFQILGTVSLAAGTAFDAVGVRNYYVEGPDSPNALYPGHAAVNLGVGIYGYAAGAAALPLAVPYFLIDNFYPGGWPQALDDNSRRQQEIRQVVPGFHMSREFGGSPF